MASEWFCRIMGEEWGPMSARELLVVARRGRLTRNDVVRRGATGTWVRAEVVKGLFDSTVAAPTATSDRLAIALRQAKPAQRSVRHARTTQYWIHNGKAITGPFNSQKLRQLAAQGRLDANFLVRSDRSGWVRAWRVKGLVFGEVPVQPSTVLCRSNGRPAPRSARLSQAGTVGEQSGDVAQRRPVGVGA
jgi:hypothetical protein